MPPYPTDHDASSEAAAFEEFQRRQAAEEAEAALTVKALAKALVLAAQPVWHWGDGGGGWVLERIVQAAHDQHLPLGEEWL